MYGSSRSIVNMHILDIGIRCLFSYFIFIFYFIYLMPHLTVIVPFERQTSSELQNFLKLLKLEFSFSFYSCIYEWCVLQFPGSSLTFAYSFGRNGCIRDPRTIQFLLEISQALHQDENFGNLKDDTNQPARLISQFVSLVINFELHNIMLWLFWGSNSYDRLVLIVALHW